MAPFGWKFRTERLVCHPSIRKLVAHEGTTITRCASIPVVAELPPEELHFRDFSVLQATPPFLVNVTGVIIGVEDETMSHTGLPMKNFKLQDRSSRYVMCTACGRHVDNDYIQLHNEVTVFFAKAQSGLQGDPGCLWVYDTAHICFSRANCNPAIASVLVELR